MPERTAQHFSSDQLDPLTLDKIRLESKTFGCCSHVEIKYRILSVIPDMGIHKTVDETSRLVIPNSDSKGLLYRNKATQPLASFQNFNWFQSTSLSARACKYMNT